MGVTTFTLTRRRLHGPTSPASARGGYRAGVLDRGRTVPEESVATRRSGLSSTRPCLTQGRFLDKIIRKLSYRSRSVCYVSEVRQGWETESECDAQASRRVCDGEFLSSLAPSGLKVSFRSTVPVPVGGRGA